MNVHDRPVVLDVGGGLIKFQVTFQIPLAEAFGVDGILVVILYFRSIQNSTW